MHYLKPVYILQMRIKELTIHFLRTVKSSVVCREVDPAVSAEIYKECLQPNEGKTRAERLKSE